MAGTLHIVSTPIGNLKDITLRGIDTLKEADLIAAEDTRRAKILLNEYGITKPVVSFHAHNSFRRLPGIIRRLKDGESVAVISDSGTPGVSDPGEAIVRECVKEGIRVTASPGPAAFLMGLTLSGKGASKFVFEGFLSNKGGRRRKQLAELAGEKRTVVIYESPHRIKKFLVDFKEIFGEREVVLARELTKKFEEITRGTAEEHLKNFEKREPRGEFVVVF